MGQERERAYGFGLSRDAHIAFVAAYVAILVTIAALGALRFAQQLLRLPWLQASTQSTAQVPPVAFRERPIPDPASRHAIDTYPRVALLNHQEGVVRLRLLVLTTGEVGNVTVVKSSGSAQLDAAALLGVENWRYLPAVRNGRPVESELEVAIRFKLTA